VKKSRAPESTKQERMHIHKHTVDLTKNKEKRSVLVPLPALYTSWSRTRCTLCSSVCAGRQCFLKTSRRGNCWCSTWNIRTNQIILSSTKGATEGETCTNDAFVLLIFAHKISQSCEWSIKFLPVYSVSQLSLRNCWAEDAFSSLFPWLVLLIHDFRGQQKCPLVLTISPQKRRWRMESHWFMYDCLDRICWSIIHTRPPTSHF